MWLEILLFLTLLLVYAVIMDRKPANSPPGPMEIPFFGCMPLYDAKLIQNLRDRYGNIVSHRTGNMRSVILFDYNTAREVMARAEFSDRPDFFSTFSVDNQKLGGVAGSNGAHWQHDRRFVLRNLRNLGMGKSYMEEAINIEAKALVEDLKKYNGEAINYPGSFHTAALNIIWQMVASEFFHTHLLVSHSKRKEISFPPNCSTTDVRRLFYNTCGQCGQIPETPIEILAL
ncbi:Cytochrome P450 [Trinorchestia longiramus]|nr:Cytochrome P450 [Trinorchestia longiramus]